MTPANQQQLFQVRDIRDPGWFHIDNEIVDVYGPLIGAYGVAVYDVMARNAPKSTQKCSKPMGEIAKQLAVSHDTVFRAIQKLIEHGLIEKEDGYLGKPCTYFLLKVPKERMIPEGQPDLPLTASGSRESKDKQTAKDVTLIASAISTDRSPTAEGENSNLTLIASPPTLTALGVTPTASRNKEERLSSRLNKTKPSGNGAGAPPPDPRHKPIELLFKKVHASWNRMPEELVPWDGREGKALAKLLREKPTLTVEQAERCIVNFYHSHKDFQQRPARTIPVLLEFWGYEKNQYGTALVDDKDYQKEQSRRFEASLGTYRP